MKISEKILKQIIIEELVEAAKRDYKAEYKKFQSSDKSKKYRAELNKYNRDKGTYGNGDGKDASHKGGKIAGFEAESKNRGRAEKSRLKKEGVVDDLEKILVAWEDNVYPDDKTRWNDYYHDIENLVGDLKSGNVKEGKLTEGKETIFDVAARVVKNHQAEKWKGSLMDATSANLLVKVYKKVNPKMKQILSKLGDKDPGQLMATLWAVVKK